MVASNIPYKRAAVILAVNPIYMYSIWAWEWLYFCFYWMSDGVEVLSSAVPTLSPPETECWSISHPKFVLEAIYTEHDFLSAKVSNWD